MFRVPALTSVEVMYVPVAFNIPRFVKFTPVPKIDLPVDGIVTVPTVLFLKVLAAPTPPANTALFIVHTLELLITAPF